MQESIPYEMSPHPWTSLDEIHEDTPNTFQILKKWDYIFYILDYKKFKSFCHS